jgi:glycolate oxidase FAD binding subunit
MGTTASLPCTETVRPADRTELAGAIRRAAESGTPVYPVGGGVGLGHGAAPAEPGLGLAIDGLARPIDYPARDLTITVEAGTTLAALAKRLAAEGQRLPIDVPQPERATIGGVVAVGAGGPRRYRWGTIRDYVIGLTAVDGRGSLFSAGGRVVKNAAGYDLCKLLAGSLGTLGVIVQVTLIVRPLPETSALVACDAPDLDSAERLLAGLVRTQTVPSAIELLAGPAWQNDPALGAAAPETIRVVVGFEGTLAEVEWMIARAREEWRGAGASTAATLVGTRADPLWERMTEFRLPPGGEGRPAPLSLEVNVVPGSVTETVRRLREIDPAASITAHAGNGVVLARLAVADPAAEVGRLRGDLNGAGGSVVVLAAPDGAVRTRDFVWGPARGEHAIMQAVKDRFDPKGILNRGRFIFGTTQ